MSIVVCTPQLRKTSCSDSGTDWICYRPLRIFKECNSAAMQSRSDAISWRRNPRGDAILVATQSVVMQSLVMQPDAHMRINALPLLGLTT